MFFISDIAGNQIPYSQAVARLQQSSPHDSVRPVVASEGITPITQDSASNINERGTAGFHRHTHPNPYAKLDEEQPKRERVLTASQIMTAPVVTLVTSDTVETAWRLFHNQKFRHVPVMSTDHRLVGIISDRDFLSLGLGHTGRELTVKAQLATPIREIMRVNVLTARPETEIRHIARIMFEEKVGALPITDEQGALVGIITGNDIIKTLVNNAPLELWT